jgi:hypothetical protein
VLGSTALLVSDKVYNFQGGEDVNQTTSLIQFVQGVDYRGVAPLAFVGSMT